MLDATTKLTTADMAVAFSAFDAVWSGRDWKAVIAQGTPDEVRAYFEPLPAWFATHAATARREAPYGVFANAAPADMLRTLLALPAGTFEFEIPFLCAVSAQPWATPDLLARLGRAAILMAKADVTITLAMCPSITRQMAVVVLPDAAYAAFCARLDHPHAAHDGVACCVHHHLRARRAGAAVGTSTN